MKILSMAPTRVSLFGGGTDIEPYSSKYGGICVNLAINIRQKVALDTDGGPWRMVPGSSIEFYSKIFKDFNIDDSGIGLNCSFDGPIESGLGSSAAAAVALIGAINKYKKLNLSREEIAERAWDIEVKKIGLYGGRQDQYVAACGGVNIMAFNKNGVVITPLPRNVISPIFESLVLFYTGRNRKSAKIQEGFKHLSGEQIEILDQMKDVALQGIDEIIAEDIADVGRLLDKSWTLKKKSNDGVSNEWINEIYGLGKECGALGGKILGAGGGGHILYVCYPDKKEKFIKDMSAKFPGLEYIDFSIDYNGLETRILEE